MTTSGGLGFDEAQIGLQLSARAITQISFLFTFNPIFRWFGRTSAVRMHQFCVFSWPVTCAFYPLSSLIARYNGTDSWLFYIATAGFYIVWRYV